MEELKIILPYPMFGPGSEEFPDSHERPTDAISVKWTDKPGSAMVDIIPNIVYQTLSGEEQHIQLIRPMAMPVMPGVPAIKFPLVVYVPGSAWHRQNVWMGLDKALYFAARGYAFAMVEYRPTDIGAAFPAQRDDVITAIRFLKSKADEYQVNSEKTAIWGDSSGGHTAVSVAVTEPSIVNCAVDWYGPTDISKMSYYPSTMDHYLPESPEGMLFGGVNLFDCPELVAQANPMNYISPDKDLPPILIMHGTKDKLVPFNQSVRLYEKLRECGKNVTFYRVEGGGHGSDGFISNEAYKVVEDFIGKHILEQGK